MFHSPTNKHECGACYCELHPIVGCRCDYDTDEEYEEALVEYFESASIHNRMIEEDNNESI